MYIRIDCTSNSETVLFAGSELKYYLSKINNTIAFSKDTDAEEDKNCNRILLWTLSGF